MDAISGKFVSMLGNGPVQSTSTTLLECAAANCFNTALVPGTHETGACVNEHQHMIGADIIQQITSS